LFLPALHSDTAAVYRARDDLPPPPPRPPIDALLAALRQPAELAKLLFNDLEAPALTVQPELARLAGYLRRACPVPVHMTGSGAAFFSLCASAEEADAIAAGVTDWSPVPLRTVSVRTLAT
jgi:4-diphosphocytidyl-2-C-methyl-D-erythritol kinase